MQESSEVRDAVVRYCELVGEADVDGADGLIDDDVAIVVGTAPGEGHEDHEGWVEGFEALTTDMPGLRIHPGEVRAFAEDSFGFAVFEPTWHLPDGGTIPTRG